MIAEDAALSFERDADIVVIQVFTQRGRTAEAKQNLCATIAEQLGSLGSTGQNAFIGYVENGPGTGHSATATQYLTASCRQQDPQWTNERAQRTRRWSARSPAARRDPDCGPVRRRRHGYVGAQRESAGIVKPQTIEDRTMSSTSGVNHETNILILPPEFPWYGRRETGAGRSQNGQRNPVL